jgi:hypothetical protein
MTACTNVGLAENVVPQRSLAMLGPSYATEGVHADPSGHS